MAIAAGAGGVSVAWVTGRVRRLKGLYDLIPERCARQEQVLEDHSRALGRTALEVLDIRCRQCAITESDRLTVESVMRVPSSVTMRQFIYSIDVYRSASARVRKHRKRLRGEVSLRRWLCMVTGRTRSLENWRALFSLGDSYMDPAT
jgi:hypothetical protein